MAAAREDEERIAHAESRNPFDSSRIWEGTKEVTARNPQIRMRAIQYGDPNGI